MTKGPTTAYVIDGMALLQSLNDTLFTTFDDIGYQVLKHMKVILNGNLSIQAIALGFDRYDNQHSIKQMERIRRGDEIGATYIIKGSRSAPSYRRFMRNSSNKAALAAFICNFLVSKSPELLADDQQIILAGGFVDGHIAKCVTKETVSDLQDLFSSQEEADTCLILHAIHFSSSFNCIIHVIVRSDDTDVLVLTLYYVSKGMLGSSVYIHAGHATQVTDRHRYIPINTIVENVGHHLCENLPAAHTLTGCDTTSSFFRIGKCKAYTRLLGHIKQNPSALKKFGLSNNLQDDAAAACAYMLHVYGDKKCDTFDQLRYVLASTTDKSAAELPPTEDAFIQHVMRARYQVAIWCQSHVPNQVVWEPIGNGWKLSDCSCLEPVMYTKEAAPIEVQDLTHLYCSDHGCNVSGKCQCLQSGLKCTEFCTCDEECQNSISAESDEDDKLEIKM